MQHPSSELVHRLAALFILKRPSVTPSGRMTGSLERNCPVYYLIIAALGRGVAAQDAEASLLSIELLTPRKGPAVVFRGEPEPDRVLAVADEFDISREVATRRYVSLYDEIIAAAFSRDGHVFYAERNDRFPRFAIRKNERQPPLPERAGRLNLSSFD